MPTAEGIDPGMLQKAADDRLDPDVLRKAGHTGHQAADAAHDEVDLDARLAGVIEGVDDLGVNERIALAPDRALAARLHMGDLLGDVGEQPLLQAGRRDRHAFQASGLGIAGDEVEDAGDVLRDHRIGREEGHVGIDARRDRMVVAGRDMAVADELAGLAPHHQR